MKPIERLVEFLQTKDKRLSVIEKDLKLSNGYLKKMLVAGGSISSEIIEKIYDKYPDLDINWLFKGEKAPEPDDKKPIVNEPEAEYKKRDIVIEKSVFEQLKSQQRTIENLSTVLKNVSSFPSFNN